MKQILIKALIGLALGAVAGGITYLWSKDVFPAILIAIVMVMSMFVPEKKRQEKWSKEEEV